ncbi:MAG: MBL fold metallo-hydrolase [Coriobacteriia bacterium]|nr:MBL fold metallo-hydrolase [Coriobacteriia bacterium]MCL2749632.1 MBL fold metallo-hydrolase [Coriobacteriia bacterium]
MFSTDLDDCGERSSSLKELSTRVCLEVADNVYSKVFDGTNTWIVSDAEQERVVIIDPGPASSRHLASYSTAHKKDKVKICAVLLTHDHPDHSAGAEELASTHQVPLFSRRAGNLPDGELTSVKAICDIQVVSLPGHSSDSVGFCLPSEGAIISGDTLLEHVFPVITWPDGSIGEYFDSLEKIKTLVEMGRYHYLLPGHGEPLLSPLELVKRTRQHQEDRLELIEKLVSRYGADDASMLVAKIYGKLDPFLLHLAWMNTQARLAYLKEAHERS